MVRSLVEEFRDFPIVSTTILLIIKHTYITERGGGFIINKNNLVTDCTRSVGSDFLGLDHFDPVLSLLVLPPLLLVLQKEERVFALIKERRETRFGHGNNRSTGFGKPKTSAAQAHWEPVSSLHPWLLESRSGLEPPHAFWVEGGWEVCASQSLMFALQNTSISVL